MAAAAISGRWPGKPGLRAKRNRRHCGHKRSVSRTAGAIEVEYGCGSSRPLALVRGKCRLGISAVFATEKTHGTGRSPRVSPGGANARQAPAESPFCRREAPGAGGPGRSAGDDRIRPRAQRRARGGQRGPPRRDGMPWSGLAAGPRRCIRMHVWSERT